LSGGSVTAVDVVFLDSPAARRAGAKAPRLRNEARGRGGSLAEQRRTILGTDVQACLRATVCADRL
jgi:hypothetical protein